MRNVIEWLEATAVATNTPLASITVPRMLGFTARM